MVLIIPLSRVMLVVMTSVYAQAIVTWKFHIISTSLKGRFMVNF